MKKTSTVRVNGNMIFKGLNTAWKPRPSAGRRFWRKLSSLRWIRPLLLEELSDPFFQRYGHCVAHIFPNRLADFCPYGQFLSAITQSHERTAEGMPIDFARDLYQATSSKKLDRTRPDDIRPATLIRTLL
jgi:hypothetical protein